MSITLAGQTKQTKKVCREQVPGLAVSEGTFIASFSTVKDVLSDKGLRRPPRQKPLPTISNESLKRLAEKHKPPAEWFEGEQEQPF